MSKYILCALVCLTAVSLQAEIPILDPVMKFSTSGVLQSLPFIAGAGLSSGAIVKYYFCKQNSDRNEIAAIWECIGLGASALTVSCSI